MFACVFIPDFSVEAVLRAEPMLRGQAIAVLEGIPPLCYVVGVNDEARQMGIQIGMTKMQVEPNGESEKRKNGKTAKRNERAKGEITEKHKESRESESFVTGSLVKSGSGVPESSGG